MKRTSLVVCLLLLLHLSAAQLPQLSKITTDSGQTSTSAQNSPSTTPTNTDNQQTPTTSSTPTSISSTTSNPLPSTHSTSSSTTSTAASQSSLTSPPTSPTASTTDPSVSTSGGVLTTTITGTGASTPSSSPSSPATNSGGDSSPSLGTGPIIGLSVAGGIAVIGVIAFIIWKLTRKRFSEFDDNEAIKWPELNSHGNPDPHAIPVHNTSRVGFETGSEPSLSRVNTDNYSTPDFVHGSGPDPYAVPPLPHLNPNQPYRDDPAGPSDFYDPYRGPVPGTIEHEGLDWSGEAIPMTQMSATARSMSPAPAAPFTLDSGRQSPGPRRASPGPQLAYGGGARYDPHGGK